MLERRGAVVIDADDLARRAIDPGTPGLVKLLDRFGEGILAPDGSVDREGLATSVFRDPQALRDLEAIIHPEVARLFAEAVAPYRSTNRVVVCAVPLLVENRLEGGFDAVVVVWAPEDVRVARLKADRGMAEQAARDRMAVQATDPERERVATLVVRNDGSVEQLEREVARLWEELQARAASIGPR